MKFLKIKGYQGNAFEEQLLDGEIVMSQICIQLDGWYDNFEKSNNFNNFNSFGMLTSSDGKFVISQISIQLDGWYDNNVPANNTQDIIYVAADNIEFVAENSTEDRMQINNVCNIFYPKWIKKDGKVVFGKKEGELMVGQRYFVVTPRQITRVSWNETRKLTEEGLSTYSIKYKG